MPYTTYKEFEVHKLLCRNCSVGRVYDCVVPSCGNKKDPQILVIGECPGHDELIKKSPFVGKAGQLLRSTMNEFGFRQQNALITNVIPCRPENNHFPTDKAMISNCVEQWLKNEIYLLKPSYLFLVGAKPLQFILGLEGISKLRGIWHPLMWEGLNIQTLPTFHPSYVLRKQYESEGPAIKNLFRQDIKTIAVKAGLYQEPSKT